MESPKDKFFNMYMTPIGDFLRSLMLPYQLCADDTLLYISIDRSLSNASLCLHIQDLATKIVSAFISLKFKINPDKTEIICARSKGWKFQLDSMILAGIEVKLLNSIISLGVKIDLNLSFTLQTNNICSSCYSQLSTLYKIQRYLNLDSRIMLANSLIISRLDYCKIIPNGAPKYVSANLQRVQNSACRFIFGLRKSDSCKDFRHHLNWLPIEQRVIF